MRLIEKKSSSLGLLKMWILKLFISILYLFISVKCDQTEVKLASTVFNPNPNQGLNLKNIYNFNACLFILIFY